MSRKRWQPPKRGTQAKIGDGKSRYNAEILPGVKAPPLGLNGKQAHLLEALANPIDPRTNAALSADLDIPEREVNRLCTDPDFCRKVNEKLDQNLTLQRFVYVKQLTKNAARGDSKSLQMALEMIGAYAQRLEVKSATFVAFQRLEDDELMAKILEMQTDLVFADQDTEEGRRLIGASGPGSSGLLPGEARAAGALRDGEVEAES